MHAPEHSRGNRQRKRRGPKTPSHVGPQQGAAHHAEKRKRGEPVNEQIERVITPDIQSADGVV